MKRIALALLLLAAPAAARAQTQASAAPEPTASQLAAAREVLQAMDMEENFRKNMESSILPQVYGGGAGGSARADSMAAFMRRMMPWNELEPRYARMYAQLFTESELHQLAAFYRTPLGRRIAGTTPEMTAQSMRIGQEQMQAHMAEFTQFFQSMMTGEATPPSGKKP